MAKNRKKKQKNQGKKLQFSDLSVQVAANGYILYVNGIADGGTTHKVFLDPPALLEELKSLLFP